MSKNSKYKVVHINNKTIEKAYKNYMLDDDHINKIDRSTYVKIVDMVMFKINLKNKSK